MGSNRSVPVLLYDGDCAFCRKWVERWVAGADGKFEARSLQEAGSEFPGIPPGEWDRAVQWVEPDGSRLSGAAAVFAAAGKSSRCAVMWARLHARFLWVRRVLDWLYALVASHRMAFSRLTSIIWGRHLHKPDFEAGVWMFLRALALVYLVAFVSYLVQFPGLGGERGILPVGLWAERVADVLGEGAFWKVPSIFLWFSSDAAVTSVAWLGIGLSLALFFGFCQGPVLFLLWFFYLSLVVAGQVFYEFQWDNLLLETGFLSLFLVRWKRWFAWSRSGFHALGRLLLLWLTFRLMFASGVVKLSSGDEVWKNLTALEYHFFTQPLPNPMAWLAHTLPPLLLKLATLGMFVMELLLPFFLWGPGRFRWIAFWGLAALQLGILATGNYGYFNFLSLALLLLLIDSSSVRRWLPVGRGGSTMLPEWSPVRWGRRILVLGLVILSLPPFLACFRKPLEWLQPVQKVYALVQPFRSVNGYGLFAVMTKSRPEILVQGSSNGFLWETYSFRYKPGALDRPPPFLPGYMPRLDWQMWFAALGRAEYNPWFSQFLLRLFERSPEVLALLDSDPFPEEPPRWLRAVLDDYRFTTREERKSTGDWWRSTPERVYFDETRRPAGTIDFGG
jgi:predicted DCC family thiol-disulfide oxidoreductase YuxK